MKNNLINKTNYPAPEIEIIKLSAEGPYFDSGKYHETEKLEGEEEPFSIYSP